MRLGEAHEDMGRFLREDCYCPGEIYDLSGFFFVCYTEDDECRLIGSREDKLAVVLTTRGGGREDDRPQAVVFHLEGGRVVDARRVDATENNVWILRALIKGEDTEGRKLDEFNPGSKERSLREVLATCDAVIVD